MTRGRNHNDALVADTDNLAHAISVLEAAIAVDRADIPATTQRRTLAASVPQPRTQPRVQIPDWFDELRGDADELARSARRNVIVRDEQRAAQTQSYVDACRDLPAAQAAHAPFQAQLVDAEQVVTEARSNLWAAERDLRNAGKLQRRSARRNVEAANELLAVAAERLARCEQEAEPTRRPLSELSDIVDHHDRIHSTRELLDDFNNLDGHADRAEHLCDALGTWKHWANGHKLPAERLRDMVDVLGGDRTLNGTNQLAETTTLWAHHAGIDLPKPPRPDRTTDLGIEL